MWFQNINKNIIINFFFSKRLEHHSPTKDLYIMNRFYCRATENISASLSLSSFPLRSHYSSTLKSLDFIVISLTELDIWFPVCWSDPFWNEWLFSQKQEAWYISTTEMRLNERCWSTLFSAAHSSNLTLEKNMLGMYHILMNILCLNNQKNDFRVRSLKSKTYQNLNDTIK